MKCTINIHFHMSSLCNSFKCLKYHHSFIISHRHCLQRSSSVQCTKAFLSNFPFDSLMYNHLANDLESFVHCDFSVHISFLMLYTASLWCPPSKYYENCRHFLHLSLMRKNILHLKSHWQKRAEMEEKFVT